MSARKTTRRLQEKLKKLTSSAQRVRPSSYAYFALLKRPRSSSTPCCSHVFSLEIALETWFFMGNRDSDASE